MPSALGKFGNGTAVVPRPVRKTKGGEREERALSRHGRVPGGVPATVSGVSEDVSLIATVRSFVAQCAALLSRLSGMPLSLAEGCLTFGAVTLKGLSVPGQGGTSLIQMVLTLLLLLQTTACP